MGSRSGDDAKSAVLSGLLGSSAMRASPYAALGFADVNSPSRIEKSPILTRDNSPLFIGTQCNTSRRHARPVGSKRFVTYVFRMDDPRCIKWLAIAIAVLTAAQVFLTIVLAAFTWRLELLTDSLVASRRSTQPSPTPEQSLTPTPTVEPILKAIPIATPTMAPSPSPHPTQVPHRTHRRRR